MKRRTTTDQLSHRSSAVIVPALFGVIPLVFDADLYRFSLLPKLVVLQIAVLCMAVLWLRDLTSGSINWKPSSTFLPAVAYLLWSGISTILASHSVHTSVAFFSQQVSFFLVYLVVSQTTSQAGSSRVLKWTCLSAVLFSLIGCLEFWGVDLGAIPSNGRPSSTFAYRNFAASYIIAVLPLAVLQVLRSRSIIDLLTGTVATTLMSLFLIYTRSRGAWLGGLVGIVAATILVFRLRKEAIPTESLVASRKGMAFVGVGVSVLVILAPWSPDISRPGSRAIDEKKSELLDAMSSLSASGAGRGRTIMWSRTLDMVADYPITGVGLDNWKLAYPPYDTGEMIQVGSAPERPHNDLLWILSETGIPGLLLYFWLLAAVALSVLRRRDQADPAFSSVLLAGILAITVHGLFSFPRERVETSFFFWCAMGLMHTTTQTRSTRNQNTTLVFPQAVAVIAVLSTLITVYAIRFDSALLRSLQSFGGGDMLTLDRSTREGLEAGPFDSRMFLLRNKVEQSMGNYAAAQAALQDGLRYHPNSVELLADLGMAYALGNDLERAESTLVHAATISRTHHQVFNNLGGVYQRMGEAVKAEESYRQATEIKVDYPDAWSNLGLLQLMSGRAGEAVESFSKALEYSQGDPALHHNLADALYVRNAAGDHERAASLYRHFIRFWRGDPAEAAIAKARLSEIESSP